MIARMTGMDKNLRDLTEAEVLAIQILPEIDGHIYGSAASIPTLGDVVTGLCAET